MTRSDVGRNDLKDTITRRSYRFVILWAAGVLLLYGIGGYIGVWTLQGYKAETEKFRQTWIESKTTDVDAQVPDIKMPAGAKPVEVLVGIYINRIGEFSIREGNWIADFDIWFRWTGDGVKPGENFQVVNGQIDLREKKKGYLRGREQYERYRVKVRLTKYFDPSRFPFSDEGVTIQVEDDVRGAETLRYIADEQGSGINRLGIPQNMKIAKSLVTVKLHNYGSGRGDPRLPAGASDIHSRFIFAMLGSPPGWGLFGMMFQALFASVAIAFIAFFIKPIHVDPRFGLGVGAFFAAIGNNIFVGTILPQAERVTLAGMVNGVGLGTIFLTLVQSAISLYILDTMGREKLRRFFDKVSFAVFLIGYAVVNLMLVFAANHK
jgi:hypothetical protein